MFSPKLAFILPFAPGSSSQDTPAGLLFLSLAFIYTLLHTPKSPKLLYPPSTSSVNPAVWYTTSPFLIAHHKPLSITLQGSSSYIPKLQYSLPLTSPTSLNPIIQSLLSKWFLHPSFALYNNPILIVKKNLRKPFT